MSNPSLPSANSSVPAGDDSSSLERSDVAPAQQGATGSSALDISPTGADLLTVRQFRAITLLLEGETEEAVAQEVGVTRYTIWRWRARNPAFIAELNAYRHLSLKGASTKAISLLARSLEVIAMDLRDSYKPNRSRAARLIIQLAGKRLMPANEPVSAQQVLKQLLESGVDESELEEGDVPDPPEVGDEETDQQMGEDPGAAAEAA